MSHGTSTLKKPTYLFSFDEEAPAKKFFEFAQGSKASLVQHPFEDGFNCKQNLKQVLVTGVGSTVFDIALLELLTNEATSLGGHYVPKR